MKTLDIIERHFTKHLTKEDFIAYLHGTILKYALQEQTIGNAANIKYYADKLVEVLSEQPSERLKDAQQIKSFDYTKEQSVETPTVKQPTVDTDEPRVFKFKIGDHVLISKGTDDEHTGVIIRLPRGNSSFNEYIVDLDDKTLGWEATVEDEGVSCKNAWYAHESNMIPLEDTPKALTVGKWYHTKDFTVEELQELLPKGTTIETEKETLYAGIDTTPPEKTEVKIVERITTSIFGDTTLIEVTTGSFLKEWFKITEE